MPTPPVIRVRCAMIFFTAASSTTPSFNTRRANARSTYIGQSLPHSSLSRVIVPIFAIMRSCSSPTTLIAQAGRNSTAAFQFFMISPTA